ncbi:MAG: hypothetical protein V9F02_01245 [Chitinophagaceae bacterium]
MNNAMHLSFQVKSSKKNEFGKAPIYARITINEVRTEFSSSVLLNRINGSIKPVMQKAIQKKSKR